MNKPLYLLPMRWLGGLRTDSSVFSRLPANRFLPAPFSVLHPASNTEKNHTCRIVPSRVRRVDFEDQVDDYACSKIR